MCHQLLTLAIKWISCDLKTLNPFRPTRVPPVEQFVFRKAGDGSAGPDSGVFTGLCSVVTNSRPSVCSAFSPGRLLVNHSSVSWRGHMKVWATARVFTVPTWTHQGSWTSGPGASNAFTAPTSTRLWVGSWGSACLQGSGFLSRKVCGNQYVTI